MVGEEAEDEEDEEEDGSACVIPDLWDACHHDSSLKEPFLQ